MATPVTMPQLGYDMTEGAIQNWLKKEGDKINKGDIIAEVETDKSTVEMESFGSGILKKIVVQPGQTVPVGTLIAVIGGENEEIDWKALGVDAPGGAAKPATAAPAPAKAEAAPAPATPAPAKPAATAPAATAAAPASKPAARKPLGAGLINLAAPQGATGGPGGAPVASEIAAAGINAPGKGEGDEAAAEKQAVTNPTPQTPAAQAPTPTLPTPAPVAVSGTVVSAGPEGRIKSSPLARKVAGELGVDIGQVAGTGPNGRVIRADVEGYASAGAATTAPVASEAADATPTTALAPVASGAEYEEINISRMRQTIARRLTEAKQQIPHFYVSSEINMSEALKLRQQINASLADSGVKISVNDLVLKASAKALRKFPSVNSGWADGRIRRYNRVNISMAVALEDGLITPVIFDTDQKSISQISVEAKALVEKARAGKLRPEEFQGGTFSISNLGMYDVTSFVAVINPPQAAILAIASTKPVVVLKSGSPEEGNAEFGVEQRMTVTFSGDHRVTDGAVAAQFLQEFKRVLENPMLLLV